MEIGFSNQLAFVFSKVSYHTLDGAHEARLHCLHVILFRAFSLKRHNAGKLNGLDVVGGSRGCIHV